MPRLGHRRLHRGDAQRRYARDPDEFGISATRTRRHGPVGECTTNCHGSYTGATALTMNTNSGWTTTLAAFGGVACGDCHNGGTRPGAANNSGAHDAHGAETRRSSPAARPAPCHGNNGGPGFTNTAAGSHGIGGVVNWAATCLLDRGPQRRDRTCSGTAACHVSAGTDIQWGQTHCRRPTACSATRERPTRDNFAWEDTATGIPGSTTPSTQRSATARPTAGKRCIELPRHRPAARQFSDRRLAGSTPSASANLGGTGPNGFTCSYNNAACHLGATPTNEGALGLTYGGIGITTRPTMGGRRSRPGAFTPKCVDCHDPHGDAVSATNNAKSSPTASGTRARARTGCRRATPRSATPRWSSRTSPRARLPRTAYADSDTPWSGLCQECHELNGGVRATRS